VVLIAAGVACGAFTLFVLWPRLPAVAGLILTAICGAAVAAGGLLMREDPGVGDWILAVAVLSSLAALHSRLVFGLPGRSAAQTRVVAANRSAAYKGREPMSQPIDEPRLGPDAARSAIGGSTTRAETRPPSAAGAAAVATPGAMQRRTRRKARSRQARVVVRKVGPWSVLKFSLIFYLCVMLVFLGALMILYGVLDAIGALDSLTRLIRDLFADQSFSIHGGWLFTRGFAIGLAMVLLWSLINVFVAFLYNLISDLVGGIEITLSEKR
jgi:hypothetical protein